jgi:hypothetical protein
MLAGEVTAATISIRPAHRAHSKTSFKNTRQISDAHGNRPGRRGFFAGSTSFGFPARSLFTGGQRGSRSICRAFTAQDGAPGSSAHLP